MKILIDSEIEQAMLQGIRNYSRISFLSAWAGTKFTAFRELNKHSKKIIKDFLTQLELLSSPL